MTDRVVWGRIEVIETFSPTRRLTRVDLPTLGRPNQSDETGPQRRDQSPVATGWAAADDDFGDRGGPAAEPPRKPDR